MPQINFAFTEHFLFTHIEKDREIKISRILFLKLIIEHFVKSSFLIYLILSNGQNWNWNYTKKYKQTHFFKYERAKEIFRACHIKAAWTMFAEWDIFPPWRETGLD